MSVTAASTRQTVEIDLALGSLCCGSSVLGGSPLLQNTQNLWIRDELYTVAHTAIEVRFSPFCLTLFGKFLLQKFAQRCAHLHPTATKLVRL